MSAIETWAERLSDLGWTVDTATLDALGGTPTDDPVLAEARAQKAAMTCVRNVLQQDVSNNQRFPEKTEIGWLDKILTAARLQELAKVRIVKAGKASGLKYEVGHLASTFYGRKILDGLGFGKRRTSLNKDEFARVVEACARIKLTLPETVEPTTTERFFAGELP